MDWLSPLRFLLPFLDDLPILRIILGSILVFFLPGFTWTLVFFRKVGAVERITLSFGMSMVMVTLSLLLLNKLVGMRITGLNATIVIVFIILLPVLIYYLDRRIKRRKGSNA